MADTESRLRIAANSHTSSILFPGTLELDNVKVSGQGVGCMVHGCPDQLLMCAYP